MTRVPTQAKVRDDITNGAGYVRITVTDKALKNPNIRRATKALIRAMGGGEITYAMAS